MGIINTQQEEAKTNPEDTKNEAATQKTDSGADQKPTYGELSNAELDSMLDSLL